MGWDLRPLLAPRSIAIVGRVRVPRLAGRPRSSGRSATSGSTGELYPINPKYDEVWGRPVPVVDR